MATRSQKTAVALAFAALPLLAAGAVLRLALLLLVVLLLLLAPLPILLTPLRIALRQSVRRRLLRGFRRSNPQHLPLTRRRIGLWGAIIARRHPIVHHIARPQSVMSQHR